MRLSSQTVEQSRAKAVNYDYRAVKKGVVHFGPGAFFRAHQVPVYEVLNATDPRFGVVGVSLHSTGVRDALLPQDGLYTLAILDHDITYQTVAALREVLVAPEDPEAVFAAITHPDTLIISSTVTEKGYALKADGALDLDHPDIAHDVQNPQKPKSYAGYVIEGLRRRKANGQKPPLLLVCDNLSNNGPKVKAALVTLAAQNDQGLANWIASELIAPASMVDSITPATNDILRAQVKAATGLEDAWPIKREAFTQWVIEAHTVENAPDWAGAGVIITRDVTAFERAKLRILNGCHSTLAYLGWLKGYETVCDAVNDDELRALVRAMMFDDFIPLLTPPDGLDLRAYAEDVLARFHNPAIVHKLSQIAWDGSQKLPIRILSTIREAIEAGRDYTRLTKVLGGWIAFVRAMVQKGEAITDPLADSLTQLAQGFYGTDADVDKMMGLTAFFGDDLPRDATFGALVKVAYAEALSL